MEYTANAYLEQICRGDDKGKKEYHAEDKLIVLEVKEVV